MLWERDRVALVGGWRYGPYRANGRGLPADAEVVSLPHCWNRQDAFQRGVAYRQGWGSYAVAFAAPPAAGDGVWWLVSEGFYGWGRAYLNGRLLGKVDGEYLGIELPLPALKAAGNDLVLTLSNRYRRDVLPGQKMPDFLLYGGLSGRVWLEFRPTYGFVGTPHVRADFDAGSGVGTLQVSAACGGAEAGHSLRAVVTHATERVADAVIPMGAGHGELVLKLPGCRPWSCADPSLYGVTLSLEQGDEVLDGCSMQVGFRHLEWRRSQGVVNNGELVALHGVNRHESMPGHGRALPAALHALDAERLAAMGLNFVRLAHYPQHPAFLDRCDQLGILVYPEIASWKSVRGWGRWLHNARRQLSRMVARDGHRPGIVMWGMGNESRSKRAYRKMGRDVMGVDDRPVSYAENHLYRARRYRTLGTVDVWGINYEFEEIPGGRKGSRLDVALVSECANAPHARRGDLRQEVIQLKRVLDAVARSAEPGVAGFALWCYNDYATLRKGRYRRYSGVVDAWREPKLSARVLAALFRTDPQLFLELRVWRGRLFAVVVGNVGWVTLSGMGGEPIRVNPNPWCCVPLDGEAVELRAQAEQGKAVAEVAGSLAEPDRVVVVGARVGEAGGDGDWWVFSLNVVDAEGRRCIGWDGHVAVDVPHGAATCYRAGEVRVDAGRGTLYVAGDGGGASPVVHASLQHAR